MDKQITLTLSDKEYGKLMTLYHLGHLVEDTVTQKSQQEILQEFELSEKIAKQAHSSGSKNVQVDGGMYGITLEMENSFLETFEAFKDFIYSGADAEEDEMIKKRITEMDNAEEKKGK